MLMTRSGVRTLLSARFIFQLEQKLREWTGQNDLTMGQFFTCVAGGSTGALVAVSIAAGTEASKTGSESNISTPVSSENFPDAQIFHPLQSSFSTTSPTFSPSPIRRAGLLLGLQQAF